MDWGNLLKWLVPVASEKGRNVLFGSNDTLKKFDTATEEQKGLHNNIISQAMGMQQQGGGYQNSQNYYNSLFQPGNQAYENFSAPYMNQFQEQVLPQIAERFAGGGALSSSGFGQSLGGAGAGLQAQLAQLFAQLQNQAAGAQTQQYNQLSQTGLNYQPFGYQKQKGSAGLLPTLLAAAAGAAGGPIGAALGQGFGGKISELFKNNAQGTTGGIS